MSAWAALRVGGRRLVVLLSLAGLAGCGTHPGRLLPAAAPGPAVAEQTAAERAKERDCLIRAMYFESNQSSGEGLLAVGSVVMNRVAAPEFPDTICGVVGQPRQFAAGVLSKPMAARSLPLVERVADEVLAGERHEKLANARFFHHAGLRFHYPNMRYVLVAGGNAFYEKRPRRRGAGANEVSVAAVSPTVPFPAPRPAAASPSPPPPSARPTDLAGAQPSVPSPPLAAAASPAP